MIGTIRYRWQPPHHEALRTLNSLKYTRDDVRSKVDAVSFAYSVFRASQEAHQSSTLTQLTNAYQAFEAHLRRDLPLPSVATSKSAFIRSIEESRCIWSDLYPPSQARFGNRPANQSTPPGPSVAPATAPANYRPNRDALRSNYRQSNARALPAATASKSTAFLASSEEPQTQPQAEPQARDYTTENALYVAENAWYEAYNRMIGGDDSEDVD